MNRSLWYAGLLLLAAGVTLIAVPGGYGTITSGGEGIPATSAGAPVTLVATGNEVTEAPSGEEASDTAEPPTETDAVSGTDTPTSTRRGLGGIPIAALVNDADTSVTVRYEASVAVDSVALRNPNGTVAIPEGGQQRLFAGCDAVEADAGTGELRVTIVRANASDTPITDIELTTQFQYDCQGRERRTDATTTT